MLPKEFVHFDRFGDPVNIGRGKRRPDSHSLLRGPSSPSALAPVNVFSPSGSLIPEKVNMSDDTLRQTAKAAEQSTLKKQPPAEELPASFSYTMVDGPPLTRSALASKYTSAAVNYGVGDGRSVPLYRAHDTPAWLPPAQRDPKFAGWRSRSKIAERYHVRQKAVKELQRSGALQRCGIPALELQSKLWMCCSGCMVCLSLMHACLRFRSGHNKSPSAGSPGSRIFFPANGRSPATTGTGTAPQKHTMLNRSAVLPWLKKGWF